MSKEAPTPHGFVVDHKESKVRYAVSARNFNPKIHDKVRPLKQHETVRGYVPKAVAAKGAKEAPEDERQDLSDDTPQLPAAPQTTK